jgi:hypothetical protein
MNIVAIDPSLISTALVVNGKIFNYCRESDAYNKSGLSKWFKLAEEHVTYRYIEYRKFADYSEGELTKLKDYDSITDMILDDIKDNINPNEYTVIGLEGYNFGAQVGDLIDLVTFSTLLRKKIYDQITNDIWVMSPSTLKLESCKLTYKPIIKEVGKKVKREEIEYRNNLGISGGKFTKVDMFYSIIENEQWNDKWFNHCKLVKDDILSVKDIKKPYEDCNDAYLIYKILQKHKTQS